MTDDLIDIRSGVKSRPLFSSEEMFLRLQRARELIARQGLDALLLCEPANVAYYANLLPLPASQPVLLLLTAERSITLAALDEGGYAYRNSFGESLAYRDAEHLVAILRRLLPQARTLGVESWALPVALGGRLKAEMSQLRGLRAVDTELLALREVLSEAEQALLRQAGELAVHGMQQGRARLQAGVAEAAWSSQARGELLDEALRRFPHLHYARSDLRLLAGPSSDGRNNLPGARWVEAGDVLDLACTAHLSGYRVEVSRCLFFGAGSAPQQDYRQQLEEAHCGVLEQLQGSEEFMPLPHSLRQTPGEGLRHYLLPAGATPRGLRLPLNRPRLPGSSVLLVSECLVPDGTPGAGGYRQSTQLLLRDGGSEPLAPLPADFA